MCQDVTMNSVVVLLRLGFVDWGDLMNNLSLTKPALNLAIVIRPRRLADAHPISPGERWILMTYMQFICGNICVSKVFCETGPYRDKKYQTIVID